MEDLQQIATTYVATAKNRLVREGSLTPQSFVFCDAGVLSIPYVSGDTSAYKRIVTAVAAVSHAHYLIFVALGNRANFGTREQAQQYTNCPDDSIPGSEPCIVVQILSSQQNVVNFVPYTRIVDAYIFGDVEVYDISGGLL